MNHNVLLGRVVHGAIGWAALIRVSLFVIPFLLGASAFLGGAELSVRSGTIDDIPTIIYYTLSLFVLGGVDLGVPSGGPIHLQILLWVAYFMAPVITVLTVIEGVMLAAARSTYGLRLMSGHVLIIGCGKAAMLYLQRQYERAPNRKILIVERDPSQPNLEEARRLYGARVLIGDIKELTRCENSRSKLLRLHRVHRVLVATGDDFVNLDVATSITTHVPRLSECTSALLADAELQDLVSRQLPSLPFEKFEINRLAVQELLDKELLPHFTESSGLDSVVLAGFGRFGSSLLYHLQERCDGELETVIIVDRDADTHWERFLAQIRDTKEDPSWNPPYRVETLSREIQEVATWDEIERLLGQVDDTVTFVLASGNDAVNMRSALSLKSHFHSGFVVTKLFESSPFAERLSDDLDLHIVEVDKLIMNAFREEWFD